MTRLIFRNKWFALLWVISVCFSIARFFGDGGGSEQLMISKVHHGSEQTASEPHRNPWSLERESRDDNQ